MNSLIFKWYQLLLVIKKKTCLKTPTCLLLDDKDELISFGYEPEVSEWVLLNANSAIFQLYHGENKLIFNEMMMSSALY
jgi:hypothetical protein